MNFFFLFSLLTIMDKGIQYNTIPWKPEFVFSGMFHFNVGNVEKKLKKKTTTTTID